MPWFPNEYDEKVHGNRYKKLLDNLSEIAYNQHAKVAEEAKKAEAESVLKKLLAEGMSADEILAKLR